MPLIDDRGRVFGRINLIDLVLLVFAVVLIPVGYGAYVLFRTPPPELLGVTPNPAPFKKGELRVQLRGEHLRPFLRATLGKTDAKAFLIESPQAAEMVFPELAPGTYDLTLYDASEQVGRMGNALTVAPPPGSPIQFVGRFVGPTAGAAAIAPGVKLTIQNRAVADVVDVRPPANGGDIPATLRMACDTAAGPCAVAGTPVDVGKPVALRMPGRDEALRFVVDDLRADGIWADVQVHLFGIGEVLDLMRVGDVDRFNESNEQHGGLAHGAVVRSMEAATATAGELRLNFVQGLADAPAFGGNVSGAGVLPMKTRVAIVSVPLQRVDRRWKYREEIIRPGSGIAFETPDYFVRGLITRVTLPESATRDRTDQ